LAEDLDESGLRAEGSDLALRPPVHERRVASSGTTAVSEDGPVSVLRNGAVLGHSHDD
jgi:hypothetical protein